jgi:putative membrane protein
MTVSVPVETDRDALPWQRLSPLMLFIHPVQELIRFFPALIGLLFAGSSSGHGSRWSLIGLALAVGIGLLRWFTTTYRITEAQVQVRRGLLRRRTLAVPLDRVRTVDVTAHAMHRMLGLARVTVGTGRSDRKKNDGLTLDALSRGAAGDLRKQLLDRESADCPSTVEQVGAPVVIVRAEPGWVRYGPFTLSGFVTIGAIAALLSRFFGESQRNPEKFGPFKAVIDELNSVPLPVAVLEVIAAVLAAVAVASTVGYLLSFWNFVLSRPSDGTLHVTRGLLTSRATTLEERRLRGAEFSEPLLLRAVGGARCLAIATGLRVGRGAERGGSVLLPPAPREAARRVVSAVLRDAAPVTVPLIAHPPVARRRRFGRAVGIALVLVALFGLAAWQLGLPTWIWQASWLTIPAAVCLAADRFASLGHVVSGGYLVGRWGSLVRRRWMLANDGIIGWNIRRSLFQRRAGLVTLTATTAGGRQGYKVQDISAAEAVRLAEEAAPGLLEPFVLR